MRSAIILTKFKGRTVSFEGRENTSDEVVVWEQFCTDDYRTELAELPEKRLIIDIGANIGSFSIHAALHALAQHDKYAKGELPEVWAFEPQKENRQLLQTNISRNQLEKYIKVSPQAVSGSKHAGFMTNEHGSSKLIADNSGDAVEVITLDDIRNLTSDRQVSLLKIDVEGSEYDIIAGVNPTYFDRIDRIAMEYHATTDQVFGTMLAKLSPYYQVTYKGNHKEGGTLWAHRLGRTWEAVI